MSDRRYKGAIWRLGTNEPGDALDWDQAQTAVLMDIREELEVENARGRALRNELEAVRHEVNAVVEELRKLNAFMEGSLRQIRKNIAYEEKGPPYVDQKQRKHK